MRRTLLVLLLLGLLAPAADAKPVKKVLIYDGSAFPEAVHNATRQWNRAQDGVKLVRTTVARRDAIPLASPPDIAGGHAALGGLLGIQLNTRVFNGFSLAQQTAVTSHVIGHALLVRDDPGNGCSIMSPALHTGVLEPACRPKGRSNTGTYRCGANRRDGAKMAKLYDAKARRTNGYCRIDPARVQASVNRGLLWLDVANTGPLPLAAGDLGLFTPNGFTPLRALAPGAAQRVQCSFAGNAQLYSPTYDLVFGAAVC